MVQKLWFIRNEEGESIAAFETRGIAREEADSMEFEGDMEGSYTVIGISTEDIEDYPDEYSLAVEAGLV